MDEADRGQEAPTDTLGRPKHRVIGFIGKGTISEYEEACLVYIGRCIAALGHTLLIVPAPGATDALRRGFEAQEGKVRTISAGVLDIADRTLLYPDPQLLRRLRARYRDFDKRDDHAIIDPDNLGEWLDTMKQLLDERGIERPT